MALALTGSPPISAAALDAAVNAELTSNWAPLASPPLTGVPTAPTAAATSAAGTTQLATTAFARNGTTTNDNAIAGQVGEFISSNVALGSAVALTTGVTANVTSISLTAGDWDVWGTVAANPAGTTLTTSIGGAISQVSATNPALPGGGAIALIYPAQLAGAANILPVGKTRISLAATTTVYLLATVQFTTSTLGAYGFIGARRRR